MTMVDEYSSAFVSRAEVRGKIDAGLDEVGATIAAVLQGRTTVEAVRELRENDPANEQGAAGLMAVAAGQGG